MKIVSPALRASSSPTARSAIDSGDTGSAAVARAAAGPYSAARVRRRCSSLSISSSSSCGTANTSPTSTMPARAARAAKSGAAASSARRTPSGPNAAPRTRPAPVSEGMPMIATRACPTPASAASHFRCTSCRVGRAVQPPLQRGLLGAAGADGEDAAAGRPQEPRQVVHVPGTGTSRRFVIMVACRSSAEVGGMSPSSNFTVSVS